MPTVVRGFCPRIPEVAIAGARLDYRLRGGICVKRPEPGPPIG